MRGWDEIAEVMRNRQEALMLTRAELIRRSGVSGRTWDDLFLRAKPVVRSDVKRNMATALDWPHDALERLATGADPDELLALDLRSPSEPATVRDVDHLAERLTDLEARVERLEQPAAGAVLRLRPAAKRRPKEPT